MGRTMVEGRRKNIFRPATGVEGQKHSSKLVRRISV